MNTTKLIAAIEEIVLEWENTAKGVNAFGGIAFLVHQKEFGHIHKNGDLDIVYGKEITSRLLENKLVKMHQYVPNEAISYPVSGENSISFAVTLLRFSYLLHLKETKQGNNCFDGALDNELEKLRKDLCLNK